jgi:hypothetical protein
LALGQTSEDEAAPLEEHLQSCDACSEVFKAAPMNEPLVAALRQSSDTPPPSPGNTTELLSHLKGLLQRADPQETCSSHSPAPDVSRELAVLLSPAAQPGELGRLAGYRVLEVLGYGGFGIVLRAEDPELGRPVALKVLRTVQASNPEARARFLREGRLMACVKHDHVVTVHRAGQDGQTPFLAMELLEGETLETRLRREGKLSVGEVIRIGRESALGLAAAHAKGLIHRDVKPANLWLEAPGDRLKILDFGLAHGAEAVTSSGGGMLGTPAFMSPEQARGAAVDHRSDLFSLGAVLYLACTGCLPFPGERPAVILHGVENREPRPVGQLSPWVPPALAELVMRLLSKDAARRPASAAEVVEALRALEQPTASAVEPSRSEQMLGMVPTPPRRRGRIGRHWGLTAAVVLSALFLLGWLYGAQVLRIVQDQGLVVIKINDPELQATVKESGVLIQDRPGQQEITLRAGDHEVYVEVNHAGGEARFTTRKFTLRRGGKEVLEVFWDKLSPVAQQPPKPPATENPDGQRQAAKWILSRGGTLVLRGGNSSIQSIQAERDLPATDLHIIRVELNDPDLSDDDWKHLQGLRDLEELSVRGGKINGAGLDHLEKMPGPFALHLVHTKISPADLDHLKRWRNLTNLDLVGRDITGDHVALLKGFPALRALGLSQSSVTDNDLKLLELLPKLAWLDLSLTQVSSAGLAHLQKLTQLEKLILTGTKMTEEDIAILRKALPNCRILPEPLKN